MRRYDRNASNDNYTNCGRPAAFLLFQEPVGSEPFTIPQGAPEYGAALEERRSWNPIAFAEKHNLKLVGANYFLVRSAEVDTAQ